ncbi:MAG: hypothetical protein VX293_05480 [Candidatus Latescibacterota bacterium]|nr:hypothetical protein [Candidatus Latescibacterota bacterium]
MAENAHLGHLISPAETIFQMPLDVLSDNRFSTLPDEAYGAQTTDRHPIAMLAAVL